jgi:hypothetical protein
MHMAYWYPTGAALDATAATADFIPDPANNIYFLAASDPVTLATNAALSAWTVDGVKTADFVIGAIGVLAKITCTLGATAPSASNWLTTKLDLA